MCNFCTLRGIQSRVEASGMRVTLVPDSGGIAVLVHKPDEAIDVRSPDDGNLQWRAWFMELSPRCVC